MGSHPSGKVRLRSASPQVHPRTDFSKSLGRLVNTFLLLRKWVDTISRSTLFHFIRKKKSTLSFPIYSYMLGRNSNSTIANNLQFSIIVNFKASLKLNFCSSDTSSRVEYEINCSSTKNLKSLWLKFIPLSFQLKVVCCFNSSSSEIRLSNDKEFSINHGCFFLSQALSNFHGQRVKDIVQFVLRKKGQLKIQCT